MILNLTQHVSTDEQKAQLVVEPRMTKEKIRNSSHLRRSLRRKKLKQERKSLRNSSVRSVNVRRGHRQRSLDHPRNDRGCSVLHGGTRESTPRMRVYTRICVFEKRKRGNPTAGRVCEKNTGVPASRVCGGLSSC
jgi:hypothetical protein